MAKKVDLAECKYTVINLPFNDASQVLTYFERIRSYIQHEDGLINSRLTWSLTVHGFLFAIFGLLAGKVTDIFIAAQSDSKKLPTVIHVMAALFFLQMLVSAFGATVAVLSHAAVRAAHCALMHIWSIAAESRVFPPFEMTAENPLQEHYPLAKDSQLCRLGEGSQWIIDAGQVNEEIVSVERDEKRELFIEFRKLHQCGASIRPLGNVLLPHFVGGGAPDARTDLAHYYYRALPMFAGVVWMILLVIAVYFFIESVYCPQWFSQI